VPSLTWNSCFSTCSTLRLRRPLNAADLSQIGTASRICDALVTFVVIMRVARHSVLPKGGHRRCPSRHGAGAAIGYDLLDLGGLLASVAGLPRRHCFCRPGRVRWRKRTGWVPGPAGGGPRVRGPVQTPWRRVGRRAADASGNDLPIGGLSTVEQRQIQDWVDQVVAGVPAAERPDRKPGLWGARQAWQGGGLVVAGAVGLVVLFLLAIRAAKRDAEVGGTRRR